MTAPLVAASAGLLAVPVLAVTLFLGSGAADPPVGTVCTVTTAPAVSTAAGGTSPAASSPAASPAGRVTVSGEQADNARVIVAAAKALGLPRQAAQIAIATARQESSLLVLANPTVPGSDSHPHQGSGSNFDSVGLFQQRPSQGWGTVGQLMDPGYAAHAFLQALAKVPGWQAMPGWQAAQTVQRSADGTAYAQWAELGAALAGALWDSTSRTLTCTTGGTSLTGPGGTFAAEACSIVPDPSNGRGCVTPRTASLALQLMAQGWRVSCWDAHAWNPDSNHPKGKACDLFPGRGGVLPTAAEKARGDALAASLQATTRQTGVSGLIWYGKNWSIRRADQGWRPYSGGGVYNPASITGGHFDHLHIDVD